jgi:hypothetical protein
MLLKRETIQSNYDCRNQPGFIAALLQQGANSAYWTSPYSLPPNMDLGVSASVRFTSNNGVRYVLSLDSSVSNISVLTRYITVGKSGFIALFDADGIIVGHPARHAFAQQDLSPGTKNKTIRDFPVAAPVYDLWGLSGRQVDENLVYQLAGVDWLARFINLSLGSQYYI